MAVNLRVHEMAVVEDPLGVVPPRTVLVKEHHYIRVYNRTRGAEFPLFIQHGQVLADAGDAWDLEDIPMWFWEEINDRQHCSPEALASVEGMELLAIAKRQFGERDKKDHERRGVTETKPSTQTIYVTEEPPLMRRR